MMNFIWSGLEDFKIELPPLRQNQGSCGFTSAARQMEYSLKIAYAKCNIRLPNIPILNHKAWETSVRKNSPEKPRWWPEDLLTNTVWGGENAVSIPHCTPIPYCKTDLSHWLNEVHRVPASSKEEIKSLLSKGIPLTAVMKMTNNCPANNDRPYIINRSDELLNEHLVVDERRWNHAVVLIGSVDVIGDEGEARYGIPAGTYWLFQDSIHSTGDRERGQGWYRNAINIVEPDLLIRNVCYGVSYPANVFIRQPSSYHVAVSHIADYHSQLQRQQRQQRAALRRRQEEDAYLHFFSDQQCRERHHQSYLEREQQFLNRQRDSVSQKLGLNFIWDHFPDYKILLPPSKHGPDPESCNFSCVVRHLEYNLLIAYAKCGVQLENVPVLDHTSWEKEVRTEVNRQGRWLPFALLCKAYGGDSVDDEDGRPKRPIPYRETSLPHWINEKHVISAKSMRKIKWLLSQGISMVAVIKVTQRYTSSGERAYVICGDKKLDEPRRDRMGRLLTRCVVIVGSLEAGADQAKEYDIASGTYLLYQESFGEGGDDTTALLGNGMNIIQPDLVIVLYYGVSYPASIFYREPTIETYKIGIHEADLLRRRRLEKQLFLDPRN